MSPHRRQPSSSPAPRRARVGRTARTSRSRPARRARLLTRRAKLNAARRPRRGVLLLVVLSLLVLFMMVGTAFIITAKQSEKTAKTAMKASVRLASEAAQTQLLDEVLLQVLRDTNNPNSSLRFHSLLGDMYGNEGIKTQVMTGAASASWAKDASGFPIAGDQIVELNLDANFVQNLQGIDIDGYGNYFVTSATPPPRFSPYDNAYNGQVLTFLSGPARGRSTRIVGFVPPNRMRIMNVQLADGSLITAANVGTLAESRILINGRPFSGTGFGYNRAAANNAAKLSLLEEVNVGGTPYSFELALLPNTTFLNVMQIHQTATDTANANYLLNSASLQFIDQYTGADKAARSIALANLVGPAAAGGGNEGYDAVDFQNMALAYLPATALSETLIQGVDYTTMPAALSQANTALPTFGSLVLPSWHRPDLLYYWAMRAPYAAATPDLMTSTLGTQAMMLRKVLLRPNWLDHPKFSGSNPEFAATQTPQQKLARMIYGPWDVDNDNDGVRDSVWIDVGLPVMAGPNGKLVKPLVAMLIVDQDGKANVNAAGTCDLAGAWDSSAGGMASLQNTGTPPNTGRPSTIASTGLTSFTTPRGIGYGPGDVNLAYLFPDPNPIQRFQQLLTGDGGTPLVPGRYGLPTAVGAPIRPGVVSAVDQMAQISMFGWPLRANIRSSFGTPPDLRARYGSAVNYHGQPVFDATLTTEMNTATDPGLLMDSPYELNLSQKTAAGVNGYVGASGSDAPFTDGELERVLRAYDSDAGSLPPRLATLSQAQGTTRNKLTTTSFDLPTPNVSLPHELANDATMYSTNPLYKRPPRTPADLVEMRVRKALGLRPFPEPLAGIGAIRLRNHMRRLVAPELLNGTPLNVNRTLGNGADDNNNGVVDEPGEGGATGQPVWTNRTGLNADFDSYFPQYAADYVPDASNVVTREDADHRQLMARHLYVLALTTAAEADYAGTSAQDKELARRIAQWAINVVDFRDADNIMTPFEYDTNPFDGWDVNGWVGDAKPGPDGILGTADDVSVTPADDTAAHRGLVWGAERPELVMTETLAWHDRNTTDETDEDPNPGEQAASTTDSPPRGPDPDFDQLYRPRGAFFMEIYNPWPETPSPSRDLHLTDTTNAALPQHDLGVDVTRTHNQQRDGSPVWRVIVTRDVDPRKDPDDPLPANRPAQIDRSIYFGDRDPQIANDGVAFYRFPGATGDTADPVVPPVRPGRYLVVGSGTRDKTNPKIYASQLGQRLDQTPSQRPRRPLRRVELDSDLSTLHSVRLLDNASGDNTVATNAQDAANQYQMEAPSEAQASGANAVPTITVNNSRCVADVAIINGAEGVRRRLTLSEPAGGYPNRVGNVQFVKFDPPPQNAGTSYDPSEDGMYCNGGDITTPKAIDTPLDDGDAELTKLGTDFTKGRRLFLQRLANPLAPYHVTANPYLTIDDTQAYITVFNGRLSQSQSELGARNSTVRSGFSSAERGYGARGQTEDRDLWKTRAPDTASFTNQDAKRAAINANTTYSLSRIPQMSLGFLNRPLMNTTEPTPAKKLLQPKQPFPWLTWNNRPFVSGNELMLVPRHRSSQMLRYFRSGENPVAGWKQYDPTDADDPQQQLANPNFQPKPFSHFENFFSTENAGGTPTPGVPLHLYRMLEYVHTPSLFVGTQTWLNPNYFDSAVYASPPGAEDPRLNLQAPFNQVSEFRDPGRINLNTVSERDMKPNAPTSAIEMRKRNVWNTLFHGETSRNVAPGAIHPGPSIDDWIISRSGQLPPAAPSTPPRSATMLDRTLPTVFANPLRSPDAGDLVPVAAMMRSGVDCTLLRSISGTAGSTAAPNGEPLFSTDLKGAGNDHWNSERNGYFRYQPIVRLDNLVTNRSNVYAMWVTIGFFEVEEVPDWNTATAAQLNKANFNNDPQLYKKVYPEGYAFTREDGVDVGNVRRIRGFYIIDRTQMAGFEPGADHNVENTVRLRRRIE
ncbi:hypothetical protein [Lacipirellula parvula]|uniref:Uncharacterized protein n=1 Tax=Lacipirellula parvula TaxID=2650471 RepID=A0A5K7XBG3_9BACT|nr:hypothetical protein [Lacipirellula parvula]BBO32191.1 hypothetical protein PLANPX_1803 [Lacipirellula parvula]